MTPEPISFDLQEVRKWVRSSEALKLFQDDRFLTAAWNQWANLDAEERALLLDATYRSLDWHLVRYARRHTVGAAAMGTDDLVQSTWERFLSRQHDTKPLTISSIRAYLFAILRNVLAMHWRRQRVVEISVDVFELIDFVDLEAIDPEAELHLANQRLRMFSLIRNTLDPLDATLLLAQAQGLDLSELAMQHNMEIHTVRTRISRAKRRLRADLLRANEHARTGGMHRSWEPNENHRTQERLVEHLTINRTDMICLDAATAQAVCETPDVSQLVAAINSAVEQGFIKRWTTNDRIIELDAGKHRNALVGIQLTRLGKGPADEQTMNKMLATFLNVI